MFLMHYLQKATNPGPTGLPVVMQQKVNIYIKLRPFCCVNSRIFFHNGELLHYFLTVECALVQWRVCQEQTKGAFTSHQHNEYNIEFFSKPV